MADLIDRAALFTDINDREAFIVIGAGDNICIDIADINKAPTVEAKPVVHGKWLDAPYVYFGAKRYVCSECKDSEFWEARFVIVKENYCPNCGADMREREKHEY